MEYITLAVAGISLILIIITLFLQLKSNKKVELTSSDKKDLIEGFNGNIDLITKTLTDAQRASGQTTTEFLNTFQVNMLKSQQSLETRVMELVRQTDLRLAEMSKTTETKLEQMRLSNEAQIKAMQTDNAAQLDKLRSTVDEKLSKTINERFEQSFKVLSTQLESVYKSLGEMQNVASNVNNLTKVLTNVKTTGIFGEIQLGAILEQILTTEQYETNFVTGSGREPVEYAVKLPGQDDSGCVYLPIDSKFPLTVYTDLYNAYENNQFDLVKLKREQLKNTIRSMAKDIKTKYINPPKTTNFAVMFLPIEGLYAEVAKLGLIEELQQSYNVTIAGPTTMSALLNSFQMGFKTLAIQKKSGEVWRILGAVKAEFAKYNELVAKIQTKLESTSRDFETLVGTRSRMIESKLKTVDVLTGEDSAKLLDLPKDDE
ncbi:MAG: DNA recombination protein RmuC [Candidatus Coproplasma sp.]